MRFRNLFIYGLAFAAWALFVASFFMPAVDDQTGWQVFGSCLMALVYFPVLLFLTPGTAMLLTAFPVINLVMFLSPLALLSKWSGLLSLSLLIAVTWPWFLSADLVRERHIGFYCWDLSFILMAAACALRSARAYAAYRQPNWAVAPPGARLGDQPSSWQERAIPRSHIVGDRSPADRRAPHRER
jgi:hypothetical protein